VSASSTTRGSSRNWRALAVGIPAALLAAVVIVFVARWLREQPSVAQFVADYPGHVPLPDDAPVGIPAWLGWQHFLNAFFLVFIVRSGWLVRTTQRPRGHWQPRRQPTGGRIRISLNLWLHLTVDTLWILNGVIFVVLLFATGQWARIVPTTWDVLPHALSSLLQYASLDWPVHDGWNAYNGVQMLAYFVTVFIAAPLAIMSGLRMAPMWPKLGLLSRMPPMAVARAVHWPVVFYFVAFTIAHVALVALTGARQNLNAMYAARLDDGWLGVIVFGISLAAMVAAWVLAKPVFVQPLAALTGKVTR